MERGRASLLDPGMADDNLILASNDFDDASVLDIVDHVLNTGIVIRGTVVISIAGVDLVYLGLDVVLTSVETALRHVKNRQSADNPPSAGPPA